MDGPYPQRLPWYTFLPHLCSFWTLYHAAFPHRMPLVPPHSDSVPCPGVWFWDSRTLTFHRPFPPPGPTLRTFPLLYDVIPVNLQPHPTHPHPTLTPTCRELPRSCTTPRLTRDLPGPLYHVCLHYPLHLLYHALPHTPPSRAHGGDAGPFPLPPAVSALHLPAVPTTGTVSRLVYPRWRWHPTLWTPHLLRWLGSTLTVQARVLFITPPPPPGRYHACACPPFCLPPPTTAVGPVPASLVVFPRPRFIRHHDPPHGVPPPPLLFPCLPGYPFFPDLVTPQPPLVVGDACDRACQVTPNTTWEGGRPTMMPLRATCQPGATPPRRQYRNPHCPGRRLTYVTACRRKRGGMPRAGDWKAGDTLYTTQHNLAINVKPFTTPPPAAAMVWFLRITLFCARFYTGRAAPPAAATYAFLF